MKVIIVLSAIIAIAAAGAVRNSGWGSPVAPVIDLELAAAAAAAGAGSANAAQNLLETVSGNAADPATLSSASGVIAEVAQNEEIAQIAVADKPSGASSTVQAINVENIAAAADSLDAALHGANSAAVTNAGQTSADGSGSIAAEGNSLNNVQTRQ